MYICNNIIKMREKILKMANELGVVSETDLNKLNYSENVLVIAMEHAHRKGHNEGFNKGVDQATQLIHKINIDRKWKKQKNSYSLSGER